MVSFADAGPPCIAVCQQSLCAVCWSRRWLPHPATLHAAACQASGIRTCLHITCCMYILYTLQTQGNILKQLHHRRTLPNFVRAGITQQNGRIERIINIGRRFSGGNATSARKLHIHTICTHNHICKQGGGQQQGVMKRYHISRLLDSLDDWLLMAHIAFSLELHMIKDHQMPKAAPITPP